MGCTNNLSGFFENWSASYATSNAELPHAHVGFIGTYLLNHLLHKKKNKVNETFCYLSYGSYKFRRTFNLFWILFTLPALQHQGTVRYQKSTIRLAIYIGQSRIQVNFFLLLVRNLRFLQSFWDSHSYGTILPSAIHVSCKRLTTLRICGQFGTACTLTGSPQDGEAIILSNACGFKFQNK